MGFNRTPQAACSPDHSRRSSGGAQRGLGAVVGPCASTPGERGRTGSLCSGDGASSEFSGKQPRAETLSGSGGTRWRRQLAASSCLHSAARLGESCAKPCGHFRKNLGLA